MVKRIWVLLVVLALLLSGWYLCWHWAEQHWLRDCAENLIRAANAHSQAEQIRALRDHLRRHVRYEGVNPDDRPFLRASARETMESGRGYCGEASRAFICLSHQLGIRAQRVNLYGHLNHVVVEVEIDPGKWVLVDPQDNPPCNILLNSDRETLLGVLNDPKSPFVDYSNLHLRRLPILGGFVQRVKLHYGWLPWILENPSLLQAILWATFGVLLILLYLLDRLLLRFYAYRLRRHTKTAILPSLADTHAAIPSAALIQS